MRPPFSLLQTQQSIRSILKHIQAEQQQRTETEGAVGGLRGPSTIKPSVNVLSSLIEKRNIIGWTTSSQSNVASKESEVSKSIVGGRYELLKMYGEGTFGAVTKAIDLEEQTYVAMKAIKAGIYGYDDIDLKEQERESAPS